MSEPAFRTEELLLAFGKRGCGLDDAFQHHLEIGMPRGIPDQDRADDGAEPRLLFVVLLLLPHFLDSDSGPESRFLLPERVEPAVARRWVCHYQPPIHAAARMTTTSAFRSGIMTYSSSLLAPSSFGTGLRSLRMSR